MKRREYKVSREIRLDGVNTNDRAVFWTPGGSRPYIWFGDSSGNCIGWIDTVPKARALFRLCKQYLEARGVKP